MARGGYRQPGHPAPVSGPGALSARTDGGPSNPRPLTGGGEYGATKELAALQQSAPMRAQNQEEHQLQDSPHIGSLGLDSARPDEPVTAGAASGAGPGVEALGIPSVDAEDLRALVAYLPVLEHMANQPNAAPSTRAWIRRIKAEL